MTEEALRAQYDEVIADLQRVCERSKKHVADLKKKVAEGFDRENELLSIIRQHRNDRKLIAELKRSFLRELEQATGEDEEAEKEGTMTLPTDPFPDSPFAETRLRLNRALAELLSKTFTGKRTRGDSTVACSSVKWSNIESIYKQRLSLDNDTFPVEPITPTKLTSLMEELLRRQDFAGLISGQDSEARRKCGIDAIMFGAADILGDRSIRLDVEAHLQNAALLSSGYADMLATRNKRRKILVVEAKKEDFDQGLAQDLLMMDIAIAENEREGVAVTPVFGIVSNFIQWNFYKYDKDGIAYTVDTINELNSFESDVRRIVGRIYNMLKHD